MLATHRTAPTNNSDCNRLYLRNTTQRSTPLTEREIAAREKFAAVAAMVTERKMDLSKVTADQEAFLAQKDQPGGKKTMKSWYWDVWGKEYDDAQS